MSDSRSPTHALRLTRDRIQTLTARYGTPLWIYDASSVRQQIAALRAFDTIRYAQKANSNVHLLKLMRAHGVMVDAVSLGEIERALAAGYSARRDPGQLVYTADVLDGPTLDKVINERIDVNAGSIDMLHQLGQVSPGHRVWLRINPGFGHGHSNKTNTGGEHSKHGIWHAQLPQALSVIRERGLRLVGLHMHIGSGVDYAHLSRVADAMAELACTLPTPIEAISAGGGLSVPYRPGDPRPDIDHYFELWNRTRRRVEAHFGRLVQLEIEPGRYLVAEAGVLVSEVRATKDTGDNHFVLVDAGFSDLMRPCMYGSHHEISLLSRSEAPQASERPTVVAGPLCESGDVFTQGEGGVVTARPLPPAQVGDLLVLHDAGAYGASMSSTYNSRPLCAEVLVDGNGHRLIRRRQHIRELLELELSCG